MATPEKPAIPEPPVGPKEGSRTRMSPEDWQAYREKRHAEMKKQAEAAGVPFPEEPKMPAPGSLPGAMGPGFGPMGPGQGFGGPGFAGPGFNGPAFGGPGFGGPGFGGPAFAPMGPVAPYRAGPGLWGPPGFGPGY